MATRTSATILSLALGSACADGASSEETDDGVDASTGGEDTRATNDSDPSGGSESADSSAGDGEAEAESAGDSDDSSTGESPEPACGGGDSEYPLEITSPKPVGDSPNGMDPEHRIYRAYPGLEYDIRVAAIGGNFPFSYELANAPAGMTIDATTGEIVWPDPNDDANDITVTVTDSSGAEVSETWSIAVGAAGFSFVDGVNGDSGGAGTIDDPWRTLADVHTNGGPDGIVYFRGGTTYTVDGMPMDFPGTDEERVEFDESVQPVMWLAHPDDETRPVIDFGYTGEGEGAIVPRIRLSGANIYLDGLETTRSFRMAFQIGRFGEHGSTFRRLHMHDTGPGLDGGNSAFIMYIRCDDCPSYGDVVMDNEFSAIDYGTGNCALKMYSLEKTLVADNVFHDTGNGSEAVVAIKDSISQFEVRSNEFYDVQGLALGGNMATTMFQTFGEFRFNNVRAAGYGAMLINQNGEVGRIRAYRNTLQGSIELRWVESHNGPISFERNVIVNDDGGEAPRPFFRYVEVADPSRITEDDDLTGAPADGMLDELGDLVGEFMRWLGTHGHQLAPCD